jgi:hypothetical protein
MAKRDKLASLDESMNGPLSSLVEPGGTDPEHHDKVAALAYKLWQERGCPVGADQEDWFRAEDELKNCKSLVASAAG